MVELEDLEQEELKRAALVQSSMLTFVSRGNRTATSTTIYLEQIWFYTSFWRTRVLFGATGTPVLDFW